MDKYEKVRVVGRGAYGTVHLCKSLSDKKMVIIKQIPVEQLTRDERQAALNEVKVLSMLDHPNIIEYYHNFIEDKALMIAMEYAEGGTLFDFLQDRNGHLLDEVQILHFFAQMLLSLQHVHSKQILHRDLKTHNILLDKTREIIKIGDFGISKILSSRSKAVTVIGTPSYISPELCEGKPYNQKSDIWALACVLYEMMTLKRAFDAQNLPALILKIMSGVFAPMPPQYSEDLKTVVHSMLHRDPLKRPYITNIIAMPVVLNALMFLHCDFGKVPCRRELPSISGLPNIQDRNRSSGLTSHHHPTEGDSSHLQPLCHVYVWGGGISKPTQLPLPGSDIVVSSVACGRTQKAAITKTGRVFIFEPPVASENGFGGHGDEASLFVPRYLEGQTAVLIEHVSCGDLFTACLTDRGILMTYGSGINGCLGHGTFEDVTQAKIVEALLGYEIIHVSCGTSHILAVTSDNEVFAWGRAENGRLGVETSQTVINEPTKVDVPCEWRPVRVCCGPDCSILMTKESKILCSGSNRFNKLGLNTSASSVDCTWKFLPAASPPLHDMNVETVALGTSHTLVVNDACECFSFGSNNYGQLGYGREAASNEMPHKVVELQDKEVSAVACGDTFSVAVTRDSHVYTWGKGSRGRLGRPHMDGSTPHPVQFGEEEFFMVTSLSSSHGNTLVATKTLSKSGSIPRHLTKH